MFGYLIADRDKLTQEEDARYRSIYCGLCRSLRSRYGQLSGFTLNYDLCFLILLLQSLYESEEADGSDPCPAHPRSERVWMTCEFSDYAADMNLALSYLKLLDDWHDDGNPAAFLAGTVLKKQYRVLKEQYPRQCLAMEVSVRRLGELERKNLEAPDEAAECFASMMAEIFVFRVDRWEADLRGFASALGRFLYIMDACMDLDSDTLRNRYNPFRRRYTLADNGEYFCDILRMILGECLFYFDRLPLVQDTGILKNILCFGLWSEFNRKYDKSRGK
ncbi:MAG: DUF5685 family protein [Oscillospiraceae bacterium]|nr:DUF5685 family protein [Oscillospiraceae bacterium]